MYTFISISPSASWFECLPVTRETGVQSQVESYQRLREWYLLNTQNYKVRLKDKVEQSKERSRNLPNTWV